MSSAILPGQPITDSVTQSNVKVVAEAPAMALASIYQSLAHATGILYENAVTAQQQQNALSQAAANAGVMQIYSLDVIPGPGKPEDLQAQFEGSAAGLRAAMSSGLNPQIVDAVNLSLRSVLDSAGDFAYGVRSATQAMQAALEDASAAQYLACMRTLKLAATAACMHAMIADVGQAEAYASVLDIIRRE